MASLTQISARRIGEMRPVAKLWVGRLVALFCIAQFGFFAATLLWPMPGETVLPAAFERAAFWQASSLPLLTFLVMPLMLFVAVTANGTMAKLLGLVMLCATIIGFVTMMGEVPRTLIHAQEPHLAAQSLALSRWQTFLFALLALGALGLLRRSEALR